MGGPSRQDAQAPGPAAGGTRQGAPARPHAHIAALRPGARFALPGLPADTQRTAPSCARCGGVSRHLGQPHPAGGGPCGPSHAPHRAAPGAPRLCGALPAVLHLRLSRRAMGRGGGALLKAPQGRRGNGEDAVGRHGGRGPARRQARGGPGTNRVPGATRSARRRRSTSPRSTTASVRLPPRRAVSGCRSPTGTPRGIWATGSRRFRRAWTTTSFSRSRRPAPSW